MTMTPYSYRTPAALLACLYALTAVLLIAEAAHLPDRVATHFDLAGHPNGWMSRGEHLWFSAIFSAFFPLLPLAIVRLMRRIPVGLVNLPHRHYWLAEERVGDTIGWMTRHCLWLACLTTALIDVLMVMIWRANLESPPHLPRGPMLAVLAGFLGCMAIWLIILLRRFFRVPK